MIRPLLLATALSITTVGAGMAQECIDTELVLLADRSASISTQEMRIIRDGHAAAFRSGEVLDQIAQGACQAIYVTYIEWSHEQKVVVDWTLVDGDEAAEAFASAIDSAPDFSVPPISTLISDAMEFAAQQILNNGVEGTNRVVDILADGINDSDIEPSEIVEKYSGSDVLVFERITWNGLPIINGVDDGLTPDGLIQYFEENVIGGPGARIEPARGFEDLPRAIRVKISKEIG